MKRHLVSLLCGTAIALSGGSAFAQSGGASESEGTGFGDIIVTARKRDETLQNVPVAVTAIGGAELADNLAQDLTKLAELAPQVSVGEGGSGTGAVIAIRGISSTSSDAGFDQSVLVEIDGVPFGRGTIVGTRLFDIENVQVLSGPQALYFGKNSPAGVISINSAEPTDILEGYVTAGYEFTADQAYVEGAISGPLSETLKARLAFRGSTQKGWTRNVAPVVPYPSNAPAFYQLDPNVNTAGAVPKRMPASDEIAGRLTLQWDPSDTFTANLKFTINSVETNSGNGNSEPYCIGATKAANAPVLLSGAISLADFGSDCFANRRTSHGGVPAIYAQNHRFANNGVPYNDRFFYFGVLNMKKSFDNLELVSTTGYYDEDFKLMNVTDWSPFATIWAAARYQYELFTQELRLSSDFDGPLNFMIGGYYEHSDRPFDNSPFIYPFYDPVADNYATVDMSSVTKGEYVSAFAELSFDITPELELSGGARWSHDKKKLTQTNIQVGTSFFFSLRAEGDPFVAHYSDDHVSPEVTLTWRPNSDNTLYVAYKTGYKSGGLSNPFLLGPNDTEESVTFQPEVSKGFEAGYKTTMAGGRLRFDINAYTYKYDDLQVVSADNSNPNVIAFFVSNAAASRVKGIQASAQFQATDELQLHGNFGLNSAKYTEFLAQCNEFQKATGGCPLGYQDLSGKRLLRAPKLTFSIGGDYRTQLITGWDTTLSVTGSHTSKYQTHADNHPGGIQEGYWLLNAALKMAPENNNFELAVIGRNLTNSYYKLQSYNWTAAGNYEQLTAFWNRPREVVIQGTVRF